MVHRGQRRLGVHPARWRRRSTSEIPGEGVVITLSQPATTSERQEHRMVLSGYRPPHHPLHQPQYTSPGSQWKERLKANTTGNPRGQGAGVGAVPKMDVCPAVPAGTGVGGPQHPAVLATQSPSWCSSRLHYQQRLHYSRQEKMIRSAKNREE